jgi:hypothetical protein
MAIDKSKKWWTGDEPDDLREYLGLFSEDSYPITEFRLATCTCGCKEFSLDADAEEGAARRVCKSCASRRFICDSAEFWEGSEPEGWKCIKCKSRHTNIGVGFSLYHNGEDIRWMYIGVRCPACGILGCFADWKIAYSPSLHLMDHI